MPDTSREIQLKSRPDGEPRDENFQLVEQPLADPGSGELLVRNVYISVDPYMRGRMRDVESYVPPFALGEAMQGGAIGKVEGTETDDSGCAWVDLSLSLRVGGKTVNDCIARVAVPASDGDNPWKRRGEQWKP